MCIRDRSSSFQLQTRTLVFCSFIFRFNSFFITWSIMSRIFYRSSLLSAVTAMSSANLSMSTFPRILMHKVIIIHCTNASATAHSYSSKTSPQNFAKLLITRDKFQIKAPRLTVCRISTYWSTNQYSYTCLLYTSLQNLPFCRQSYSRGSSHTLTSTVEGWRTAQSTVFVVVQKNIRVSLPTFNL